MKIKLYTVAQESIGTLTYANLNGRNNVHPSNLLRQADVNRKMEVLTLCQ